MGTVVLKFGGAALKNLVQLNAVADIIVERKKKFTNVVVVVSAMGKTTNELIALAYKVCENPPERETDMLISAGERISMALLAIALTSRGVEAKSFTGSQAGIITSMKHSNAEIVDVRPWRIMPHFDNSKVIIIAGFQGVSAGGEITTLGRGGSDTTAVALAANLGAHKVEFYKDVHGIFTLDPKQDPEAEHIPRLSYDEAISVIAKSSKKVLHPRAVRLAEKNGIPLHVLSFENKNFNTGSVIVSENLKRPDEPLYELDETLNL